MNVIEQMKFELANYDVAAQYVNHYSPNLYRQWECIEMTDNTHK